MPMAGLSAVFTSAAAVLFYLALRRMGVAGGNAGVAVAGAAFAAGWWYFAGEAEVLAGISFFLAGALSLLAAPRLGLGRVIALGLWLGLGTVYHQTLALFLPVACFITAWAAGDRIRRCAFLLAAYAAVVAPAYVLIPRFYYDVDAPGKWLEWVTYYARWGDWAHYSRGRMGQGVISLLAAVAAGPNPFDTIKTLPFKDVVIRYGPAAFVLSAVVLTVVIRGRALWRERGPWLIAAGAWFVGYQIFFSLWEPENVEWWIGTTMPLWFVFGLAAPRRKIFAWAAAPAVAALAVINLNRVIYPATEPGRNDAEAAARAIAAVTKPGDTVLMSHVDTYAWLDYVTGHKRQIFLAFSEPGPDAPGRLEEIAARGFPDTRGNDASVYFTDNEWEEPSLVGRPWADEMRAVFFRMLRPAEPVTACRFPGRDAVVYRFRRYASELKDVAVYEANATLPEGALLLGTTGAHARYDVVVPTAGGWTICLQARGAPAKGVWPVMAVSVDGWEIGRVSVDARWGCLYETTRELTAGRHTITAAFANDYYDAGTGENRDLWVSHLVLYRRPFGEDGDE